MGRRSFGTTRQLPSGRWQARYPAPDGRRRSSPGTFATKKAATQWLAKIETDLAKGTYIDPMAGSVTLRAYADGWLSQRTVKGRPLAPRTRQTYRHSLDAWILPKLGGLKLAVVSPALVRTWHAETLGATGPTATRQAYALLRAIFNTAVADDAVARNPCRIAGAGQPSSPERPLLDLEAVERLIAALPEYMQTLATVAFWAHLRLGEVLALQRRDVDLKAGTLRVERQIVETKQGRQETPPKAASRRVVHLPAHLIDDLRSWLTRAPTGLPSAPVFTRPDGTPLRHHHVEWHWRQARSKVGLEDAKFHDLRHAGLTLTAQLGATTAEVMRRAGHSSTRAAAIYQHAAANRDAEIAKLLGHVKGTQRSS